MKLKFNIIKTFITLNCLAILNGCLSIAKLSDFPKTSTAINFDKYSMEYQEESEPYWTAKTSNEYYFERRDTISEIILTDIIKKAMMYEGYAINEIDLVNDYVLGKRGMYANEWSSITGVYYKLDPERNRIQIYINTKITQDITGGWSENRSKKVGLQIEKRIDSK
ncbi:MAG: hypothetical protein U0W24_08510 [Bacteroidales bacterium]